MNNAATGVVDRLDMFRRAAASLVVLAATTAALVQLAPSSPAYAATVSPRAMTSGSSEPAVPTCISFWGEARYRPFGYDHIVHIKSTCAKSADCVVWTNVNAEKKKVLVPANAKVEVFTFLVSPSREFTPYVECKLRS
jgi:hypothetical protein